MALYILAAGARLDRIPMRDAEVYYLPCLALAETDTAVVEQLIGGVPWAAEHVVIWGRRTMQPRLIAWYGDPERSYAYSGIRLQPLPWTPILLDIKTRIEHVVASPFNSVLLNYYRDNRDSMGFHSDDEPELGQRPTIASLSLGQERTFILKHKTSTTQRPVHLRLPSGSLLLMKGDTQRYWKHGIPKETHACGPRVNLTFRQIVTT
jgi:alkylated DNA repair dioxygenase AlkB